VPGILEDLQRAIPAAPLARRAGVCTARKYQHFESYEEVSKRFGKLLALTPWLINPMFAQCSAELTLPGRHGPAVIASQSVEALLAEDQSANTKSTASRKNPYVVVKADNGTYGMGIMTVRERQGLGCAQPQDHATR
jgi:glutamate--cysteine ligase